MAYALFAIAVGTAVLVGWFFDVPLLKNPVPGFVTMKANTALTFVLAGGSMLLLSPLTASRAQARAGQALALIVALIGGLTLGEYILGWQLGIDELLFEDAPAPVLTPIPGRMAISAAAAFLLLGLALFAMDWEPRRRFRPSELLALLILVLSSVTALEYAFGHAIASQFFQYTHMAPHTFVAFMVLGTGVLTARPAQGVLGAIRARLTDPLESRIYLVLVLGGLALLATSVAAYFSAKNSVARAATEEHVQEVRLQIVQLLSSYQDLQTAQRGYAITGDEIFLQPYESGLTEAEQNYRRLAVLVQDDSQVAAYLGPLKDLRDHQIEFSNQIVNLRRSGGAEAAMRLISSGEGERAMNNLRVLLAAMNRDQSWLLAQSKEERRKGFARLNQTLLAAGLFELFMIVFAGVVIQRDFGRRHRAEAALRANEESLATTLHSIGDAVLVTDTEGRVIRMNAMAERLTGWFFADAQSRPVEEVFRIVNEQTRAPAVVPVAKVLATGEIQGLANHTVLIARDGTEWPVADSAAPIRDAAGQVSGVVLVFRDVTMARQAERTIREHNERLEELVLERTVQLRESEERLNFALRKSGTGGWDLDLLDHTAHRTLEHDRIFGYGSLLPQWTYEMFLEHVLPEDRAEVDRRFRAAITAQAEWNFECRIRRADGEVRWILATGEHQRDEVGQTRRMAGIVQDITERKMLEDQIRQTQKMEAVGQLAGGIAHDFNNLLTVVLGNLQLLEEPLNDQPEAAELLQDASKAAWRGAELCKRILAFSRRQNLSPEPIAVNDLVMGLDQLLKRTLGGRIDVRLEMAPDLQAIVVDSGQLENALLNLALNAHDAMPDGGTLSISTAAFLPDADYVAQHADVNFGEFIVIDVSDTGQGMTADTIAHAFEPFFTTKETGKGSGLGLSMVYGFLKQSGGHARIYSELGIGTSVKLYFPAAAAHTSTQRLQRPVQSDEVRGGSECILVVEDDAAVRATITTMLSAQGYAALEADSGAAGLETLRRQGRNINLLVSDIVMPGGMDGYELVKQGRILFPNLKIVLVSGFSRNHPRNGFEAMSGVAFLNKPFLKHELARIVRQLLDS